jgi:hypothetical protein
MPFYIFKISPDHTMEYLDEKDKYRAAKDVVRNLRAAHQEADGTSYRMVFANSVGQGETLLTPSNHDHKIIGDD